MAPKLLGIKVSGCHLVPVIVRAALMRLITWLHWSIDQQLQRDSNLRMVEYQILGMLSTSPQGRDARRRGDHNGAGIVLDQGAGAAATVLGFPTLAGLGVSISGWCCSDADQAHRLLRSPLRPTAATMFGRRHASPHTLSTRDQSLDEPAQLRRGIEENLRTLEMDSLPLVNLRLMRGSRPDSRFDDQLAAMTAARDNGLIGVTRPHTLI